MVGSLNVQLFRQHHGLIDSLGIRIGDFVYSSDVADFPEESKPCLSNIKVWILDCLDYKSNKSHAGLDKILEWNMQYSPEQILLTNMHHNIDYHTISEQLPKNIAPLYDGYKFNV
jgi:phosphoribosyl 1,2-cyclic phosphate phosphodiesterase